jgi:cupin fold WbuC family metalloprotein
MNVRMISADVVDRLRADSRASPRRRQHMNLHKDHAEPVQRLLNVIQIESYIRPHRHSLDPKTESLFALAGRFVLFVFDDGGQVIRMVRLGSEKYVCGAATCIGIELSPGTWHTVLATEPDSLLLELKAGPFDTNAAKEHAPWAPGEGTEDGRIYLGKLREMIQCMPE